MSSGKAPRSSKSGDQRNEEGGGMEIWRGKGKIRLGGINRCWAEQQASEDVENQDGLEARITGVWDSLEGINAGRSSCMANSTDLRFGLNRGRPSTVIPKTVRPSHKKGVKT